jgi:hypothetical protein
MKRAMAMAARVVAKGAVGEQRQGGQWRWRRGRQQQQHGQWQRQRGWRATTRAGPRYARAMVTAMRVAGNKEIEGITAMVTMARAAGKQTAMVMATKTTMATKPGEAGKEEGNGKGGKSNGNGEEDDNGKEYSNGNFVGELANLTWGKMRKRRQSPTCVSRAPLQKMISSIDHQNITVIMLKISQ